MKTLILALIAICLFPPAQALCQTVTWTSSHPDIVSVDENTGTVKMIGEPAATTDVTITQTTIQNGKTTTSTKTVQVDSCTACFTFNSLSYCGVKLSNGQCWMDRNIGASSRGAIGLQNRENCPTGWRMPTSSEFLEMLKIASGNANIALNSPRRIINSANTKLAPMYLPANYLVTSDRYYISGHSACYYVSTGFFNWGFTDSINLYRTDSYNGDVVTRCIKS